VLQCGCVNPLLEGNKNNNSKNTCLHDCQDESECISAIVKPVRHLLSNWLGWLEFRAYIRLNERSTTRVSYDMKASGDLSELKSVIEEENWSLSKFASRWSLHHQYWRDYAEKHGVPLVEWRYEDMCSNSQPFSMLLMNVLRYNVDYPAAVFNHLGKPEDSCWAGKLLDSGLISALVSPEEKQEVFEKYGDQLRLYGFCDEMYTKSY
jgi:hypothetical protein